jgi:hypothetical protein
MREYDALMVHYSEHLLSSPNFTSTSSKIVFRTEKSQSLNSLSDSKCLETNEPIGNYKSGNYDFTHSFILTDV